MPELRDLIDLASERLGGSVVYANDDFFAAKENLLKAPPPVWKEHEYTDRGKWMDGWESRRKRIPGHDFAIVRLGARGIVRSVVVDTSFFRGNFPESCSIDALSLRSEAGPDELLEARWVEILPRTPLQGDQENRFAIAAAAAVTHIRFNIYPDGGVARLRVFGEVVPEWRVTGGLGIEVDLAAAENGGDVLTCSDMFFGPKHNLVMPGRARDMSDGWETRRRRGAGHDWVVVRLAAEGRIRRIEIDTAHFKGNHPDTCSIDGSSDGERWTEMLGRTKLQPHTRHFFADELLTPGPFTHLRLNVFPDGGVSRLRVWGVATARGRREAAVRQVNSMLDPDALLRVCSSRRWAAEVAAARPFASWESLVGTAAQVWLSLDEPDHLEAFAAHPRIGERRPGWSAAEQSGTDGASAETMADLARLNRLYEEKFGFVYLVCAAGRTAGEMLEDLRERLSHDRATELRIAAEQQRLITDLRFEKLVTE